MTLFIVDISFTTRIIFGSFSSSSFSLQEILNLVHCYCYCYCYCYWTWCAVTSVFLPAGAILNVDVVSPRSMDAVPGIVRHNNHSFSHWHSKHLNLSVLHWHFDFYKSFLILWQQTRTWVSVLNVAPWDLSMIQNIMRMKPFIISDSRLSKEGTRTNVSPLSVHWNGKLLWIFLCIIIGWYWNIYEHGNHVIVMVMMKSMMTKVMIVKVLLVKVLLVKVLLVTFLANFPAHSWLKPGQVSSLWSMATVCDWERPADWWWRWWW